jgi:hypothetical protein
MASRLDTPFETRLLLLDQIHGNLVGFVSGQRIRR